ncbi:hypothetical protein P7H75_06165 [Vagococcus carniphilus]|uniref:hypothetical protein n=1 Tax=Vagococcus carniphilus TaxID=218144 RepID=UPI00289155D7|nr:hypothetical protein [Vagococcus carniphilus]MDT2814425.1 hypothetical protein [Vagococcus carniphilus]
MNKEEVLKLIPVKREPYDYVYEFYSLKMLCPKLTQAEYASQAGISLSSLIKYIAKHREQVAEEIKEIGERINVK